MPRTQQEADPKLCWNCGELGRYAAGVQIHCLACDVMWIPSSSVSVPDLDETRWQGAVIECVDFTKPGALSSPA
jgi:hypothetical protein